MKLLLCSDFSGVGYRFLDRFFANTNSLNCLFVGYATEDENEMESGSAKRFRDLGINVIQLTPNYKFADKIDIIFVRGGNTTRLIHLLRKYNQYDKIEMLARSQNILYVGSSAGAILAGHDTAFTLASEPYDIDLVKLYGEDALKGYSWVDDKLIFVHASKHRLCYGSEMKNENDLFRTVDNECYPAYQKDIRKFAKEDYIKIANNQVFCVNGDSRKLYTFNWNNIPIKAVRKKKEK